MLVGVDERDLRRQRRVVDETHAKVELERLEEEALRLQHVGAHFDLLVARLVKDVDHREDLEKLAGESRSELELDALVVQRNEVRVRSHATSERTLRASGGHTLVL